MSQFAHKAKVTITFTVQVESDNYISKLDVADMVEASLGDIKETCIENDFDMEQTVIGTPKRTLVTITDHG